MSLVLCDQSQMISFLTLYSIGGYLAQAASVRWCYFLPAIINATIFVFMIFALPESLFSRAERHLAQHQERTYFEMLFSFRRNALLDRRFRLRDMARPFEMLQYPSVTLTFICYTVTFAFASILPAVTVAILFTKTYHFKSGAIGLMLGLPLLIGSALGEFLSGPLSDWFMYRYAKRHDGERKPEARLPAALGSILLCPAGIIIYGVCLQHKTHWIGPVMGMAISSFGLQLVTTVSYAYCSDCYKPQSGEISSLYNFGRQIFAFPLGFYAYVLLAFALRFPCVFPGIYTVRYYSTFERVWRVLTKLLCCLQVTLCQRDFDPVGLDNARTHHGADLYWSGGSDIQGPAVEGKIGTAAVSQGYMTCRTCTVYYRIVLGHVLPISEPLRRISRECVATSLRNIPHEIDRYITYSTTAFVPTHPCLDSQSRSPAQPSL